MNIKRRVNMGGTLAVPKNRGGKRIYTQNVHFLKGLTSICYTISFQGLINVVTWISEVSLYCDLASKNSQ